MAEGEYPITIKSYYDSDRLSDTRTIILFKEECKKKAAEPAQPADVEVVIPPTLPKAPEQSEAASLSFEYIIFLAVAGVIVFWLVAYGFLYLVIKR